MAQDALLLLENDQALALSPDGDSLVVFDPDTGAGAECCCGGSGSGPCCKTEGTYACLYTNALHSNPTTPCGKRTEVRITGTLKENITEYTPGAGLDDDKVRRTYAQKIVSTLGAFWELSDQKDPICRTTGGFLVPNTRVSTGKETLPGFGYSESWSITKTDAAFDYWGRSYINAGGDGAAPCRWDSLGNLYGGGPPGAAGMCGAGIKTVNGGTQTGANIDPGAPVVGFFDAAYVDTHCSGTATVNGRDGNGWGPVSTASYTASASATGGSFVGSLSVTTYSNNGRGGIFVSSERTVTVSVQWSVVVTLCDSGPTFPGCAEFAAAWLAGGAMADLNGDGFVNGDDYDLFAATHPECNGVINPGVQKQVNDLRAINRPVRFGTPASILGIA
jgi:hypothetical protein